jgi:hypothetical protein
MNNERPDSVGRAPLPGSQRFCTSFMEGNTPYRTTPQGGCIPRRLAVLPVPIGNGIEKDVVVVENDCRKYWEW